MESAGWPVWAWGKRRAKVGIGKGPLAVQTLAPQKVSGNRVGIDVGRVLFGVEPDQDITRCSVLEITPRDVPALMHAVAKIFEHLRIDTDRKSTRLNSSHIPLS